MADLEALAGQLSAMIDGLQQHIEARAWELAEPQILAIQDQADVKVAELERELAARDQRFNDLQREIRRQNKARDREFDELKRLRAMRQRVVRALVVCHTDADGNRHAPYDALRVALEGENEAGR